MKFVQLIASRFDIDNKVWVETDCEVLHQFDEADKSLFYSIHEGERVIEEILDEEWHENQRDFELGFRV